MGDLEEQIESLRERARESEDIIEADRDPLIAFSDRLRLMRQKYTDYRHKKLLGSCVRMAEGVGGLDAAREDRAAAEEIVAWINSTYDNEETNRDYRSAIRVFGKRLNDDDEVPESLEWVPTGTSSDYDPTPDPRDMLHWTEGVLEMVDAAFNARDEAMFTLQFDAGLRGGEFKDLTIGDVQDHKHGLQVTVEGKQGRRTVPLIPSSPHVNDWLKRHPADRTDRDAPLWSKLHTVDGISDHMVLKAFKEAAKRAGVHKPVTLTNFRKSSAAFLASRNLNQAHIEDHHGWVRGSRVAARYISVFGGDSDREIAKVHGVDIPEGDEPDPLAPIPCPRCSSDVPRHEPICDGCGQAMTPQAAQELAEAESEGYDSIISVDNPEDAETVVMMLKQLGVDTSTARRLVSN